MLVFGQQGGGEGRGESSSSSCRGGEGSKGEGRDGSGGQAPLGGWQRRGDRLEEEEKVEARRGEGGEVVGGDEVRAEEWQVGPQKKLGQVGQMRRG